MIFRAYNVFYNEMSVCSNEVKDSVSKRVSNGSEQNEVLDLTFGTIIPDRFTQMANGVH